MAVENNLKCMTYLAADDLSAKQYYFVTVDSDGNVDLTGDGAAADGVLQNDPAAAGRAATVAVGGQTKIRLGGTVTAGDAIASDTNGAAVTAGSGDVVLGRCIEGGSSGKIGSMLFHPRGALPG